MSTPLPKREGAAPTEVAPTRHTEFNLPSRLLLGGRLFVWREYLGCWVGPHGVEMTGWSIMHGMSSNLRVEVAS